MRKLDLIALLNRIPGNPEVAVWQSETIGKTPGCDSEIEVAVECDDVRGERVVILGMDIPANDLTDARVWGK
jgi:hypothetical protein